MAKRAATSVLNHDNWAEETKPEEPGSFKTAPTEVLKDRVMKTPKRKLDESQTPSNSPFTGFGGFGEVKKTSSESPFSFLKTNGAAESPKMPIKTSNSVNNKSEESDREKKYYSNLRGLNESVSSWITTHVQKNPLCILTPIFRDYEKHLAEIEAKYGSPAVTKENDTNSLKLKPSEPVVQPFSFGLDKRNSGGMSSSKDSGDVSIVKKDSKESENKPLGGFSFGEQKGFSFGDKGGAGFSFGMSSGSGFTFGNVAKPVSTDTEETEESEADDPPKVTSVSVPEEGSFYSKRCKLFFKRDGSYQEHGLGTLHLKPAGEKTQLIVRADTAVGILFLNIILSSAIPIQRVGKNNVMLVCIPDANVSTERVSTLLRVKTEEDADELYAKLNEYKK